MRMHAVKWNFMNILQKFWKFMPNITNIMTGYRAWIISRMFICCLDPELPAKNSLSAAHLIWDIFAINGKNILFDRQNRVHQLSLCIYIYM